MRVDESDRVGERALRGGDELHVELGEVGTRPADVRHPLRHALLASGSEAVDLAIGPLGRRVESRDEAPLFQPRQRDVHLGFVDPLGHRSERPGQTSAQLVSVGRLLRQHRQHDFLLHAPTFLNGSVS